MTYTNQMRLDHMRITQQTQNMNDYHRALNVASIKSNQEQFNRYMKDVNDHRPSNTLQMDRVNDYYCCSITECLCFPCLLVKEVVCACAVCMYGFWYEIFCCNGECKTVYEKCCK